LWSLNRSKFNQILRNSILCRKHLCEDLFKSEVFSALSEDEKEKFLDNLKEIEIKPNTYIIKEGQIGDRFFIVLDGSLVVEKMDANDFIKPVYEKGDYFGEIALIRNVPRQASVKALTTTKLAYIERSTFKRILGSLEEILKRN
jgi:cAMP-dependent protein kinase regulator